MPWVVFLYDYAPAINYFPMILRSWRSSMTETTFVQRETPAIVNLEKLICIKSMQENSPQGGPNGRKEPLQLNEVNLEDAMTCHLKLRSH